MVFVWDPAQSGILGFYTTCLMSLEDIRSISIPYYGLNVFPPPYLPDDAGFTPYRYLDPRPCRIKMPSYPHGCIG